MYCEMTDLPLVYDYYALNELGLGLGRPRPFRALIIARWIGPRDTLGLTRLIHDPTITPQFPGSNDYGNFMFSKNGSAFRSPAPY